MVICLLATFIYALNRDMEKKFTINSLIVAFAYLILWIPTAVTHFLSYSSFRIYIPDILPTVTHIHRLLTS